MTCREFTDFIADYLSAELPEQVQRAFERHLDVCVNCRRYLEQYRETIACGRVAFDDPAAVVPDEVPEDLVGAILATRA